MLEVSIMVLRCRLKAVFYEATTCSELSIPACNGRIPSSPQRYLQALSNAIKVVISQSVCPLIRLLNVINCSAHKGTTGRATPTARRIYLAFKISDVLLSLHCLVTESTIRTARVKPHRAVVAVRDEAA